MNVAQLTVEGDYVALDSGQHVHIHPSSVLFNRSGHTASCLIIFFQDFLPFHVLFSYVVVRIESMGNNRITEAYISCLQEPLEIKYLGSCFIIQV